MIMHSCFFGASVLFWVLCCFLAASGEDGQLVSVVVIFRHGDRTPVRPYPNDPYKNVSLWPVDFGQLTNIGKRQQFALGRWLRNRYADFLPPKYSETDIRVRSTDVDRTLMSAEANLAGLYPPVERQIWNEQLRWQPVPVHTIPEKQDGVLGMKKPCPKYDSLLKKLLKSGEFAEINRRNHDLYAYLTRYSGATVNSLETLEFLYNTLHIESLYNFTLPDWTKPVYPAKMKWLADLSFATACYTREMARLRSGPLFNEILTNFGASANASVPTKKVFMYSGHDITIANVLNTLGVFSYHSPPYASTVIFELRKMTDGFYIEAFYKNETDPKPLALNCPGNPCRLQDFAALLADIVIKPDVWEKECHNVLFGIPYTAGQQTVAYGLLSSLLVLVTALAALVAKLKCKKSRSPAYSRLPDEDEAVG